MARDCVLSLQASSGLLKHNAITQIRCCGLHNLMCLRAEISDTHSTTADRGVSGNGSKTKGCCNNRELKVPGSLSRHRLSTAIRRKQRYIEAFWGNFLTIVNSHIFPLHLIFYSCSLYLTTGCFTQ